MRSSYIARCGPLPVTQRTMCGMAPVPAKALFFLFSSFLSFLLFSLMCFFLPFFFCIPCSSPSSSSFSSSAHASLASAARSSTIWMASKRSEKSSSGVQDVDETISAGRSRRSAMRPPWMSMDGGWLANRDLRMDSRLFVRVEWSGVEQKENEGKGKEGVGGRRRGGK